jgi:hypothetical protein
MATPKNLISIPRPPADAFNKHRPVSTLLTSQMEHMAAAIKQHLDETIKSVKTEGEAAACIKKTASILRSLTGDE